MALGSCVFCLHGIAYLQKTEFSKRIKEMGGDTSYSVSKKTTHLITTKSEVEKRSFVVNQAFRLGIPILSEEFLADCLEKEELLQTDGYLFRYEEDPSKKESRVNLFPVQTRKEESPTVLREPEPVTFTQKLQREFANEPQVIQEFERSLAQFQRNRDVDEHFDTVNRLFENNISLMVDYKKSVMESIQAKEAAAPPPRPKPRVALPQSPLKFAEPFVPQPAISVPPSPPFRFSEPPTPVDTPVLMNLTYPHVPSPVASQVYTPASPARPSHFEQPTFPAESPKKLSPRTESPRKPQPAPSPKKAPPVHSPKKAPASVPQSSLSPLQKLKEEVSQEDDTTWNRFSMNPKPTVYPVGSNREPRYSSDYELLRHIVLQVTDVQKNNNKYYSLEMHCAMIDGKEKFRLFSHYGRTDDLETKPNAGRKETRYCQSLNHAKGVWASLMKDKKSDRKGYKPLSLFSSNLGSEKARGQATESQTKVRAEEPSQLTPPLQELVKYIFDEATAALTSSVAAQITARGIETPLGVLSLQQIKVGEDILEQIAVALDNKREDDLEDLSNQFYTQIPHRIGRSKEAIRKAIIRSMDTVQEKQELLQLMRDMLQVNASGALHDSIDTKYKALGCTIDPLSKASDLYKQLEDYVITHQVKSTDMKVLNIYAVRRGDEHKEFSSLHNRQLLFHGSRLSNFVGLLTRGILLPKAILKMGGSRTNFGWLGSGIYFGNASCTSTMYAAPGSKGSRMMLLCRAALGDVKQYTRITPELDDPPPGYHSVQGVRRTAHLDSDFYEDEFVIYNTNQQKQEYLVEFTAAPVPLNELPSASKLRLPPPVSKFTPSPAPPSPKFDGDSEDSFPLPTQADPPPVASTETHVYPSFSSSFTTTSSVYGSWAQDPSDETPSEPLAVSTQPFSVGEVPSSFAISPKKQKSPRKVPAVPKSPQPAKSFSIVPSTPPPSLRQVEETQIYFPPQPTPSSLTSYFTLAQKSEYTLPPKLAEMKAQEDRYREIYAQDRSNPILNDLNLNLIDVYQNHSQFLYEDEDEEELKITKILSYNRAKYRKPSGPSVVSEEQFFKNWEAFTAGQFHGFDWNNVFVAGGSVLGCMLTSADSDPQAFRSSDIDLFLYGITDQKVANEKIKSIYHTICQNTHNNSKIIRTKHAVTIINQYPHRHAQIVLRLYKSPAEVLMGFDIDSVTVGFDGRRVWALPRAQRAINKGYNLIDMSRRSLTYEVRLLKYAKRGFAVAIPGFDRSKVNPAIFHQLNLRTAKGLAKLLFVEFNLMSTKKAVKPPQKKTPKSIPKKNEDDTHSEEGDDEEEGEESDYSELGDIPWGPGWFSGQIMKVLDHRDKAQFFSKAKVTHSHIFVSGIEGVLEGKSYWCKICQQTTSFGPLSWLIDNPGRQLLTGSFHPVSDSLWDKEALVDSSQDWFQTVCNVSYAGETDRLQNLFYSSSAFGSRSLNSFDSRGWTPLAYAAFNGHSETVRSLISHGADIHQRLLGVRSMTALHFAVYRDHEDVVRELLDAGASVDPTDAENITPLHLACYYDNAESARLLIQRGASLTATDSAQRTPSHMISLGNSLHCAEIEEFANNNNLATPPTSTPRPKTIAKYPVNENLPLHRAIGEMTSPSDLSSLLTVQSLHTPDKHGATALHAAAQVDHVAAVEWLLTRGADPNRCDRKGQTPLHYASRFGSLESAKVLLSRGALGHFHSFLEHSPLQYALVSLGRFEESTAEIGSFLPADKKRELEELVRVLQEANDSPVSLSPYPLPQHPLRFKVSSPRKKSAGKERSFSVSSSSSSSSVESSPVPLVNLVKKKKAPVRPFGSSLSAPSSSAAPSFSFGSTPAASAKTTSTPSFGSTAPSFGSSFGSTAPSFGSSAPSFGSTAPLFGKKAPRPFGSSATPPIGFGSTALSSFGAPPSSTAIPSFGSSAPSFGSTAPSFRSTAPSFGSSAPSFGASSVSVGSLSHLLEEYRRAGPLKSSISKLLLLVSILHKGQQLNDHQKDVLKDLILKERPMVLYALECFEVTSDISELSDTLRRLSSEIQPVGISQGSQSGNATWKRQGTLHMLDSGTAPSTSIYGFDMDGTLIRPKGSSKFPQSRNDWQWLYPSIPQTLKRLHREGHKIVIFSNQGGIAKGHQRAEDIEGKILDLRAQLGIPLAALFATDKDLWRKPSPALWNAFVQHLNGGVTPDLSQCLFVGDAAGRQKGWKHNAPKDISCSDRAFAFNVGIRFSTPEEFFLLQSPVPFEWDSVNPNDFLTSTSPLFSGSEPLVSSQQEIIVFVGQPASGKSTFAEKHLIPHGYVHVNQDTLGTKDKCVKACQEAVNSGKSVVVDNTNAAPSDRNLYVSIAKSKGIRARCFIFRTDAGLAQHLNIYREKISSRRAVPGIGYNLFKSKFQEPSSLEGFSEIKNIHFKPEFKSEQEKKLFLERT